MDPSTNEHQRLARAYRAVPALATRMSLEQAMNDAMLRRLLERVAETQEKPRRRTWGQYFKR